MRLLFVVLQFARHRSVAELLAAIDRWGPLLRAVEAEPPEGSEAVDEFAWYLVDTSDLTEEQILMAFGKHLDHPENQRMTTGQRIRMESRKLGREEGVREGLQQGIEQGIEKGLEKGIERGRTEGLATAVLRLLHHRFGALPADDEARVRHATTRDLERWTDRVLDAATLHDVFAD